MKGFLVVVFLILNSAVAFGDRHAAPTSAQSPARSRIERCEPDRQDREAMLGIGGGKLVAKAEEPDYIPDIPHNAEISNVTMFEYHKPQSNPFSALWNKATKDRSLGFAHHGLVFMVQYRMPNSPELITKIIHGPSAGDYEVEKMNDMLRWRNRRGLDILVTKAKFRTSLDPDNHDTAQRMADSRDPRFAKLTNRKALNHAMVEMRNEVERKKKGRDYSCKTINPDQKEFHNCQLECIWACKKLEELYPKR